MSRALSVTRANNPSRTMTSHYVTEIYTARHTCSLGKSEHVAADRVTAAQSLERLPRLFLFCVFDTLSTFERCYGDARDSDTASECHLICTPWSAGVHGHTRTQECFPLFFASSFLFPSLLCLCYTRIRMAGCHWPVVRREKEKENSPNLNLTTSLSKATVDCDWLWGFLAEHVCVHQEVNTESHDRTWAVLIYARECNSSPNVPNGEGERILEVQRERI